MVHTIIYEEPRYLAAGKAIYEQFEQIRPVPGNFVSIISDAMRVLRQQGPIGLDQWVSLNKGKRKFILDGMVAAGFEFSASEQDMQKAWTCIERTARVLRHAKYYGKAHKQ